MQRSAYSERIDALAERASDQRERFERSETGDAEQAMAFLREGVGPAIAVYLEARTGAERVTLSAPELAMLRTAMNTSLELYAACYGVQIDASFTVREAAEALLDTENIRDVAVVLTQVPVENSV